MSGTQTKKAYVYGGAHGFGTGNTSKCVVVVAIPSRTNLFCFKFAHHFSPNISIFGIKLHRKARFLFFTKVKNFDRVKSWGLPKLEISRAKNPKISGNFPIESQWKSIFRKNAIFNFHWFPIGKFIDILGFLLSKFPTLKCSNFWLDQHFWLWSKIKIPDIDEV